MSNLSQKTPKMGLEPLEYKKSCILALFPFFWHSAMFSQTATYCRSWCQKHFWGENKFSRVKLGIENEKNDPRNTQKSKFGRFRQISVFRHFERFDQLHHVLTNWRYYIPASSLANLAQYLLQFPNTISLLCSQHTENLCNSSKYPTGSILPKVKKYQKNWHFVSLCGRNNVYRLTLGAVNNYSCFKTPKQVHFVIWGSFGAILGLGLWEFLDSYRHAVISRSPGNPKCTLGVQIDDVQV